MKGTYDNGNYRFAIQYFNKGEEKNKYYFYGYAEEYDKSDGITVGELFGQKKRDALHLQIECCDGLALFCASIDPSKIHDSVRGRETLAKIFIDEEDLYNNTIEYALAIKMMRDYSKSNDVSKRMILTFLERYVADYRQVREFAQTGKNILEGVDPLFGISAQGTVKPENKKR